MKKSPDLTDEQLERRDIVSGEAERVLVLTDDVLLEARLGDVVQLFHVQDDLLFQVHELSVPPHLSSVNATFIEEE